MGELQNSPERARNISWYRRPSEKLDFDTIELDLSPRMLRQAFRLVESIPRRIGDPTSSIRAQLPAAAQPHNGVGLVGTDRLRVPDGR